MGVCTKERKGVAAEVLMATPCTNSLGGVFAAKTNHVHVSFEIPVCSEPRNVSQTLGAKYKKGTYHAGARRGLSDHGVAGACLADKKHVLGGCPVDLF